jgi:hypothetical protein
MNARLTDPVEELRSSLPQHGPVACTTCFGTTAVEFDRTRSQEGEWRITANPLAWGGTHPEVLVLGFSKGPTQAGAMATTPHDAIAFKGSRKNVARCDAAKRTVKTPDRPVAAFRVFADSSSGETHRVLSGSDLPTSHRPLRDLSLFSAL